MKHDVAWAEQVLRPTGKHACYLPNTPQSLDWVHFLQRETAVSPAGAAIEKDWKKGFSWSLALARNDATACLVLLLC